MMNAESVMRSNNSLTVRNNDSLTFRNNDSLTVRNNDSSNVVSLVNSYNIFSAINNAQKKIYTYDDIGIDTVIYLSLVFFMVFMTIWILHFF